MLTCLPSPNVFSGAMMGTLKLIREGVHLRKTQKSQNNETDGDSFPSLSRLGNWEDTELYRAIEKVRQSVQPDEPDEDDSEATDSDFS